MSALRANCESERIGKKDSSAQLPYCRMGEVTVGWEDANAGGRGCGTFE